MDLREASIVPELAGAFEARAALDWDTLYGGSRSEGRCSIRVRRSEDSHRGDAEHAGGVHGPGVVAGEGVAKRKQGEEIGRIRLAGGNRRAGTASSGNLFADAAFSRTTHQNAACRVAATE